MDNDLDPLLSQIGEARFVLLGEATHGTHEFYKWRAEITKRLILEKGFQAVAIEADWPDAYRVNRYVNGGVDDRDGDGDAREALAGFQRFPQWMWRNEDVVDFVEWLRAHNDNRTDSRRKVGIYGLDLYSLHASIAAVLQFLDHEDPEAAKRARHRYACFEHHSEDPQDYAYATGLGLKESCERQALEQLLEVRSRAVDWAAAAAKQGQGLAPDRDDTIFEVEQNARLVRDAEAYYRHMFRGRVSTWNLRDRHMATTLGELGTHLDKRAGVGLDRSKIVVWEHNSHLGDARATYMAEIGELNVGQLARERFGRDAFLVGFTTYDGTVTAASGWDGPAEQMNVRPAIEGSYEALFHETELSQFLLMPAMASVTMPMMLGRRPLLERAIGVVYRPQTERASHYFEARLADQFDAVIHVDRTRAVEPLERLAGMKNIEPPETYPFAV